MAGRFAYFMIAGAAIVGGMALQGDIDFGADPIDHEIDEAVDRTDAAVDRAIDRAEDRGTASITVTGKDGEGVVTDSAAKRALAEAVAELVRAEGSLIAARLDENMPAAAIEQAEQRRDAARQVVEQLADTARAEARTDRDELRQSIRDGVREEVRDAVRS